MTMLAGLATGLLPALGETQRCGAASGHLLARVGSRATALASRARGLRDCCHRRTARDSRHADFCHATDIQRRSRVRSAAARDRAPAERQGHRRRAGGELPVSDAGCCPRLDGILCAVWPARGAAVSGRRSAGSQALTAERVFVGTGFLDTLGVPINAWLILHPDESATPTRAPSSFRKCWRPGSGPASTPSAAMSGSMGAPARSLASSDHIPDGSCGRQSRCSFCRKSWSRRRK